MVVPLTLKLLKAQWRMFANTHPLGKGVISYAVIWPTGCLVQQTMDGKNFKTYDWMRCLRFSIFGAMFIAPTLYGWVRLSSAMWPQMNLRVGIIKAAVEQISYGPYATACFFYGMNRLEGGTHSQAVQEVQDKFLKTFEVGLCIWPILQTINYSMVPESYRVVFVSVCSLGWTTFLALLETKKIHPEEEDIQNERVLQ